MNTVNSIDLIKHYFKVDRITFYMYDTYNQWKENFNNEPRMELNKYQRESLLYIVIACETLEHKLEMLKIVYKRYPINQVDIYQPECLMIDYYNYTHDLGDEPDCNGDCDYKKFIDFVFSELGFSLGMICKEASTIYERPTDLRTALKYSNQFCFNKCTFDYYQ